MKRILCIALILIMGSFALVSCKSEENSSNVEVSSEAVSSTLTLDEIKEQAEKPVLTKEEANSAALEASSVAADKAINLLCNLEFSTQHLCWTYVVEFEYEGYAYSIDIDAVTGNTLYFMTELK